MNAIEYWGAAVDDPRLRVLVACEYSGTVRDAFTAAGHNAVSCDLLPCDKRSGNHIQGDALALLRYPWDLVIAHPPCTYLCNSGVCWLVHVNKATGLRSPDVERWPKMLDGARFFRQFELRTRHIPYLARENPIPHSFARGIMGRYTQIIQPWQFGHAEQKATCLWLRGLPKLRPTRIMTLPTDRKKRMRLHYLPQSADRWKIRSQTFRGIARAMAAQWGTYILAQRALEQISQAGY
jgi:hypothetical protein